MFQGNEIFPAGSAGCAPLCSVFVVFSFISWSPPVFGSRWVEDQRLGVPTPLTRGSTRRASARWLCAAGGPQRAKSLLPCLLRCLLAKTLEGWMVLGCSLQLPHLWRETRARFWWSCSEPGAGGSCAPAPSSILLPVPARWPPWELGAGKPEYFLARKGAAKVGAVRSGCEATPGCLGWTQLAFLKRIPSAWKPAARLLAP